MNDLAQVRGKGMSRVTSSYNQIKLFLTKGFIIRENDIEGFVRDLKPDRLDAINQKFSDVLVANHDVTVSDKTTNAKLQKETKQTIKAAKAFAKVLGNNFGLIPSKENLTSEEDWLRVIGAINNPKNVATKLEAALFIEQNMEDILKGTLFALRMRPGFQEVPNGPAKDFIQFIKDKNLEVDDDAKFTDAVQKFEKHIREGGIDNKILEKYPKNREFLLYKGLKEINVPTKESPLESLKIIQNRANLREEMKATPPVTPERLFQLIRNPKTQPYIKNVYASKNNEISFQFFVKAAEYKRIKRNPDNPKLQKQLNKVESELKNMIEKGTPSGGKLNLEPHRQEILNMPNLEGQVNSIKEHLLKLESSQYSEDIKKALLSGKKLEVQRDNSILESDEGKKLLNELDSLEEGDDTLLKFK